MIFFSDDQDLAILSQVANSMFVLTEFVTSGTSEMHTFLT